MERLQRFSLYSLIQIEIPFALRRGGRASLALPPPSLRPRAAFQRRRRSSVAGCSLERPTPPQRRSSKDRAGKWVLASKATSSTPARGAPEDLPPRSGQAFPWGKQDPEDEGSDRPCAGGDGGIGGLRGPRRLPGQIDDRSAFSRVRKLTCPSRVPAPRHDAARHHDTTQPVEARAGISFRACLKTSWDAVEHPAGNIPWLSSITARVRACSLCSSLPLHRSAVALRIRTRCFGAAEHLPYNCGDVS